MACRKCKGLFTRADMLCANSFDGRNMGRRGEVSSFLRVIAVIKCMTFNSWNDMSEGDIISRVCLINV